MSYDPDDTIAAIASAPIDSRAADASRGIIRVTGPQAIEVVQECVVVDASWPSVRSERLSGRWMVDRCRALPVSLFVWPGKRSYTRQPTVEIHTVGAAPILNAILRRLCRHDVRLAQPGEFTMRAFLAGRLDLVQAEAVLAVIDAGHRDQLQAALEQLAGGVSHPLGAIRAQLIDACADVEAGLDFVDEDLEFISDSTLRAVLEQSQNAIQSLIRQLQSRDQGLPVPHVALRGVPNCGKSTLWNALVEPAAHTALVSDEPGTTRDYLVGKLLLPDVECRLTDTAGIDESLSTEIDATAQRLGQREGLRADVTVRCIDGSRPLNGWELAELRARPLGSVWVVTKRDRPRPANWLPDGWSYDDASHEDLISVASHDDSTPLRMIWVSGVDQRGLSALRVAIGHRVREAVQLAKAGGHAAVSVRCLAALQRANDAIERARTDLQAQQGHELVAAELRSALQALAEVVGEVYTDDILDRVFSRFCIGK